MTLARMVREDFFAAKKTLWKSVLYITALLVLVSLVFCYATTARRGMKKADEVNVSAKNFWVKTEKPEIVENKYLSWLQNISGVTKVYIVGQRYASASRVKESRFTMEGMGTVDGCSYDTIFRDHFPAEFEREMAAKDLGPLFSAGRYLSSDDEIVCSQEILDCFGITDPNQAIGKTLEVSYQEMGVNHVFTKRIAGVFNPKIVELDYYQEQKSPMICFSFNEVWNYVSRPTEEDKNLSLEEWGSKELQDAKNLPNLWFLYEGYYDSFLNEKEIFKKLHEVDDEAIAPIKQGSKKISSLKFQSGGLVIIFSVVCACVCAAMICVYLLGAVKRAKEGGARGLEEQPTKRLFAIVFIEELIKATVGIILGIAVGAVAMFGFGKMFSYTVGATVTPNYLVLFSLFGVLVGVSLLWSCLTAAATCHVRKEKNGKGAGEPIE